jgi:hypothetical protein
MFVASDVGGHRELDPCMVRPAFSFLLAMPAALAQATGQGLLAQRDAVATRFVQQARKLRRSRAHLGEPVCARYRDVYRRALAAS